MEGDVVPLPQRSGAEPAGELAIPQYRIDTSPVQPMRSRAEILKEAALLVPNLAKLLYRLCPSDRPRLSFCLLVRPGKQPGPVQIHLDTLPLTIGALTHAKRDVEPFLCYGCLPFQPFP